MADEAEFALKNKNKKWVIIVDKTPWIALHKINLALENLMVSVIEKIWKCTQMPAQPMANASSSVGARLFIIATQPLVTSRITGIIIFIIDAEILKKSKILKIISMKKDWFMMFSSAENKITKAHMLNIALAASKQDLTKAVDKEHCWGFGLFSTFDVFPL